MSFILGLVGAPLWILWFKISPLSLGRNAFNGFLRQQGISKRLIPRAATDEIVEMALQLAEFMSLRKNTMTKIACYTNALELDAKLVRYVLLEPNRSDMMLSNAKRQVAILEKHGVRVVPITAPGFAPSLKP